jgi:hypothetical protein
VCPALFLRNLLSTFYPDKGRIYSYRGWCKYTHKWNYSKGSGGVVHAPSRTDQASWQKTEEKEENMPLGDAKERKSSIAAATNPCARVRGVSH